MKYFYKHECKFYMEAPSDHNDKLYTDETVIKIIVNKCKCITQIEGMLLH